MPIITITLGQGQASTDQKKELIRRCTAAAIEVTTLPERAFTVLIHELPTTNIGVAGKTLAELKETGAL